MTGSEETEVMTGIKTAIVAAAALFGTAQQDVAPTVKATQESQKATTITKTVPAEQRVTIAFTQLTFAQVLERLSREGVSFVAPGDAIDPDRRVTLSFTNAPLREVLTAVAQAFGGHWKRVGSSYVFTRGGSPPDFFGGEAGLHLRAVPELRAEELKLRLEGIEEFQMPNIRRPAVNLDVLKGLESIEFATRAADFFPKAAGSEFDVRSFVGTVTPEQWEKHVRRGYLTLGDLEPTQREHFANWKGDWRIEIQVGGKALRLRSK